MSLVSEWNVSRPLVIAHRGANRQAPENTLAAFRHALTLGADAVELDTKLTADGYVVVIHDQTLDRTTEGAGRVTEHTLAEIRALEAGSHFSPAYAGEKVPTLDEVFDAVGSQLLINVEMGNYASPRDALAEAVVDVVRRHKMERRVLLSSFNPLALRRARANSADIPLGLLLMPREPGWQRWFFSLLSPKEVLHLNEALIRPEVVARAHRQGRMVIAWTVNEPARMTELLDMRVDGLITDVPEAARQAVQDAGRST